MKTLKPDGTITETEDVNDKRFPPSKTFRRTVVVLADGIHGFYQLPDGKTTEHLFKPMADIVAAMEAADPNFKLPPHPVNKTVPKTP